jgi:DNA replication and repair protein RecF
MLYLQSLSLTQFRNCAFRELHFDQKITAITGPNGAGKTNLLDAIYYLCFTRSYFSGSDASQVMHGSAGFRLGGKFLLEGHTTDITLILRENGKKELARNGVSYEKFSLHIGSFPCVMVAPDDVELITGGSEIRRRYLDTLFCQLDADYLQQLIVYNKVLQQRNSYLKQCARLQARDHSLLDILNGQLAAAGTVLYAKRRDYFPALQQKILHFYQSIAGKQEELSLMYESQLQQCSFEELLEQRIEKDYLLQRSTGGIHRDDLALKLKEEPFKTTASQGQRKSLLFALKLAEAQTLKEHKGFAPILLLDDVFEKLDAHRMHNLLAYICDQLDAQVFLTDTHKERILRSFEQLGVTVQLLELP